MSGSPINGPKAPVDMRDIHAIRETVEREARIAELRAQDSSLFRAELRARVGRIEAELLAASRDRATMLRHLEALVTVPAAVPVTERVTIAPPPSTWAEHVEAWRARTESWLARQPTNRALLYGLAVAGVGATLSACAAAPLAHALLGGLP